ncbi:MAG: hypothetical protein C6P35_01160 [Cohnella sp.]|jgi:hypothetical protein|uniref:hypothetical protein n=1 Tax=Cohnella sp. TaxID=1883426 RepID=UPI000E3670DD|nr:hypothetical protein [Cohnella sp.]REK68595.1 MAG: hypothetical protein C6P35_01160 [Cohnella sp.]
MAAKQSSPPKADSKRSKVSKRGAQSPKRQTNDPILGRLTVVWVQPSGLPLNTTGFRARLFRNDASVSTASFDSFGVARFSKIRTLTNVSYTLRVFDSNGVLFRTRTIPAGVETYTIIG